MYTIIYTHLNQSPTGDLVNVDVTLYLEGVHADTARSWICGEGDDTGHRDAVTATATIDDGFLEGNHPWLVLIYG